MYIVCRSRISIELYTKHIFKRRVGISRSDEWSPETWLEMSGPTITTLRPPILFSPSLIISLIIFTAHSIRSKEEDGAIASDVFSPPVERLPPLFYALVSRIIILIHCLVLVAGNGHRPRKMQDSAIPIMGYNARI